MAAKPTENGDVLVPQRSIEDCFEPSTEPVNGKANKSNLKCLQDTTDIVFNELNFFPIAFQSNIYGIASLVTENSTELLVATLSGGKVYSLKFNPQSVQSTMKVVGFSYIPG